MTTLAKSVLTTGKKVVFLYIWLNSQCTKLHDTHGLVFNVLVSFLSLLSFFLSFLFNFSPINLSLPVHFFSCNLHSTPMVTNRRYYRRPRLLIPCQLLAGAKAMTQHATGLPELPLLRLPWFPPSPLSSLPS